MSQSVRPEVNDLYSKVFDYDGSGNVIYDGAASPGAVTSAAAWAIRKYTYSGSNVVSIQWAGGTTLMDKIWDNRAGLSYS